MENTNSGNNSYWREIMRNILFGLFYNNTGEPGSHYYNETEKYFKILLKNLFDFDADEYDNASGDDYMQSDILRRELVDPFMDNPDPNP